MKVLFVLMPAFNPDAGGVPRTTYKLGKFFSENGFEVGYFSLANEGHIETEYGKLYHSEQSGRTHNPNNLNSLKEVIQAFRPDFVINQMPYEKDLRDLLATEKYDYGYLLLGCLRNSLFSVVKNLDAYGKKVLPSVFTPIFKNALGRKILLNLHFYKHRSALQQILEKHDRFILLTPPNHEELRYFIGDYEQEKVCSIPNSIPAVHSKTSGNLDKQKIMLHVGRLNNTQKRADLLLPFWKKVYKELLDWEFVVVGDGPYKAELAKQIEQENIPRITLQGQQKPALFYKKASLFIMPSAYEGFPNVILEAQSYGLVPLAFNSYAALSWIVNDQKDAFLSRPYDTLTMANQAIKLARDTNGLQSVQEAAFRNAQRFTIDKVGNEWLKLFEHLKSSYA